MCAGIPCHCTGLAFFSGVSCPDRLLPVGPVSLKLVGRSYPKPNHSPSVVLPQVPLFPAKSFPGFICTVSMLVSAEKGGKSFLRAQEKQIPEFYSSSWLFLLFQVMSCEAGLETIGPQDWLWGMSGRHLRTCVDTTGAGKVLCGMVCELSGHAWAVGRTWVGF